MTIKITTDSGEFSERNFVQVLDMQYTTVQLNPVQVDLEMGFLLVSTDDKRYKVVLKFIGVTTLRYEGEPSIMLSGFQILDIKDRGWEGIRYQVYDYEEDDFKLYCYDVQVVSVLSIV